MCCMLVTSALAACPDKQYSMTDASGAETCEASPPLDALNGKARSSLNILCQAACGECVRPFSHPKLGPLCWALKWKPPGSSTPIPDPYWTTVTKEDQSKEENAREGDCKCKEDDSVCRLILPANTEKNSLPIDTWYCRGTSDTYLRDVDGKCQVRTTHDVL